MYFIIHDTLQILIKYIYFVILILIISICFLRQKCLVYRLYLKVYVLLIIFKRIYVVYVKLICYYLNKLIYLRRAK